MKHEIEYQDDKILVNVESGSYSVNRTHNDEKDNASVARIIEMLERESFYKSEHFINEFNEMLETAILATRSGGSGAVACRDTLLSLYNGNYKANLSSWYNLDSKNREALLFVLEHQTTSNRKDIDLYLPQYADDFKRMKNEVE